MERCSREERRQGARGERPRRLNLSNNTMKRSALLHVVFLSFFSCLIHEKANVFSGSSNNNNQRLFMCPPVKYTPSTIKKKKKIYIYKFNALVHLLKIKICSEMQRLEIFRCLYFSFVFVRLYFCNSISTNPTDKQQKICLDCYFKTNNERKVVLEILLLQMLKP